MENGLVLLCVKDGIMYPVALDGQQYAMFKIFQEMVPQPINVVLEYPLGKVDIILNEMGCN